MHGGNFNGYCAFFQDITERRRTEKALKASDAKFARAFRASPFAVSLASAKEHRLIDVNDAWVRLFGYRREDAVGRTPLELGLLEDPEDFHRINRQVAAQGGSVRDVECRFRVMDGSSRTGSLSIEEFQTNGEAARITVISDTTALRNAEATLSRVSLRLIEGQDQERFRIARDLHDDIGQRLALLQFGIDRLKDDSREPTTDLPAGLDDLWNQAAEISSAVQALSRELHSPALNILRVDKALRNLCADINKRLNMEIDFISHDVPNAVPSDTSVGLFRVLQEALHNAATHSGTRYVEVELWSEPGVLQMKVKDFGTGFPVEATMEHPGLGLVAMRERVALMKGTLSITSTPEVGTEVSVRVPLSAD